MTVIAAPGPTPGRISRVRKRGELNKRLILETALRIVDEGGIEALSIRRIAEELAASPMALYRHVKTRDEILEGLVDLAMDAVTPNVEADVPWDELMRQIFTDVHRRMLAHPGLLHILATQPTSAARAMRAAEQLLASLRSAGFSGDQAVAAVAAAQSYTFGFTVQRRARTSSDRASHLANLKALPDTEYPVLHALAADFGAWSSEHHYEVGLEWLLTGIRTSLTSGR